MKAYIAGPLWKEEDRKKVEEINNLCKELGFETFVPHLDAGIYEQGDSTSFFEKDSKAIDDCKVIVAILDWKSVGSGTAWEIGYAYAKGIPVIGLVEDLSSVNTFDRMCVMTFNSAKLVDSVDKLKQELVNLQA